MPAPTVFPRAICLAIALLFLAGCDDDKKDKPEYEVEIYFSEDVKVEWIRMKAEREFKKPRVQVHHPGGVEVTHVEREARKKVVYDFAPMFGIASLALLILVRSRRTHTNSAYAYCSLPSPTYQRG